MSVEIQWDIITSGADGRQLAEQVRAFIHDRFQQVELPRFIRSVKVHSFDFGDVAPEVELKDICDPLPDFYEENEEDVEEEGESDKHAVEQVEDSQVGQPTLPRQRERLPRLHLLKDDGQFPPRGNGPALSQIGITSPMTGAASTPGILRGGTATMNYFNLQLGGGRSGATTPLAAFGGGQFQNGWHETHAIPRVSTHPHSASASSNTPPTSIADPSSRPVSQQHQQSFNSALEECSEQDLTEEAPPSARFREKSDDDVQIVTHVRYAGNICLSLTAEILLDYPMPSFVGIPLKLNITGLTFDGVAILAYIRNRCHFCFLQQGDAEMLLGNGGKGHSSEGEGEPEWNLGLLQEIKVESEIGERGDGKQSLKNVGKVEKFVLEQVRRIFEDEFVYPSFWTFLV